MRALADGDEWKMPATIDDPAILDEVTATMQAKGMAQNAKPPKA
jgi:propionyl-CoA synthetase